MVKEDLHDLAHLFNVISHESIPAHDAPTVLVFQILEQVVEPFLTAKTSPMLWPPFLFIKVASSHP